jgi:protoporphyrinogen/coproporphyrinogen III oxidase
VSDHDVVVVGAGIAGLVVAHDLARAGHSVLVLTGGDLGGTIRSARLGDLTVDVGAEAFARRSTVIPELLADLDLADRIVEPAGGRAWLVHAGGAAPLPENSWLGIPAKPWAPDVRLVIGWRGALRASADLLLPPSRQALLADRVGSRMGVRVRNSLVAPVLAGVYSTPVDQFRVAELPAPTQETLGTQRRLTAVARRLGSGAAAGAAVAGLEGGIFQVIDALGTRAVEYGAEFTNEPATGLSMGSAPTVISASGHHCGRAVVVATDGTAANRLLGLTEPPPGSATGEILLCTVLLDHSGLNDTPRGSGVLVAPGTPGVAAKALTHSTAKWTWLAVAAGPGRHVLRLSYGRRGEAPPPDSDFPSRALADAGRLLGVPIGPSHLVDHVLTRWPLAPPRDDRPLNLPHVWTTGAWRAGTGLVAAVTAARATAKDVHAQLSAGSAPTERKAGSVTFERKEG